MSSATASVAFGFNTPFFEQIEFLRRKLALPSERWDDIKKAAHDRAFIVAGAMKADLVDDLRTAVVKAAEQGTGIEAFRRDFAAIVQKHGWHGWTGEGSQAGEAWRTKVIYQTNMATSYAAGRYRQLTDLHFLKLRPYWRYVHDDSVAYPRPLHALWGRQRLTLRHDHPFWKTHFPPNGWGCHCRVTPVVAPDASDATEPPQGWNERNAKGNLPGIDKGFDYAFGAHAKRPLKSFIDEKLINLAAPIGAAMYDTLRPVLVDELRAALAEMVDAAKTANQPAGLAALAHVVAPRTVADLARRGVPLESSDVWLRDEELLHALRDSKSEREATLPLSVWRALPDYLDTATPYLDTRDTAFVYAFDLPDEFGKVVVRVNYADKINLQGKRTRFTSNFVRTGGVIKPDDIQNGVRYVELEK